MLDKDMENLGIEDLIDSDHQDEPIILKNEKFSTAALAFSIRISLTGHNLAYASLLARMQMNATKNYPTLSSQQVVLADLYDLDFAVIPQLYGNKLILTYIANFVEPHVVLDPDYTYDRIIETLADIIQHPLFDQQLLDLSKQQLLDGFRELMESPANRALDSFFRLWYKDSPDYANTFMGPIEEIQDADLASLKKYAEHLHQAPALIYGIARDPDYVGKLAEKNFNFAGLLDEFWSIANEIPAPKESIERIENQDNLQAQLFMGYGFQSGKMTYQEQAAGLILVQYLAGDQSSKLFTKIREELGAAYSVEANNYANNALLLINAGLDPAKVDQAKEIIQQEINEVANGNVDKELFTKAKKAVRNIRSIREDQESFYLAEILKKELFVSYADVDFAKLLTQTTTQSLVRFAKKLSFKESYVLK